MAGGSNHSFRKGDDYDQGNPWYTKRSSPVPVEDLPAELDGVADELHVHFPWGSLLRAVGVGKVDVLPGLNVSSKTINAG